MSDPYLSNNQIDNLINMLNDPRLTSYQNDRVATCLINIGNAHYDPNQVTSTLYHREGRDILNNFHFISNEPIRNNVPGHIIHNPSLYHQDGYYNINDESTVDKSYYYINN